ITAARKADGTVDLDTWKSVQTSLITHCQGQANRMAILDAPPNMDPQQIKEWRADAAMYDSKFAALYYPWIKVANPAATNRDRVGPFVALPECAAAVQHDRDHHPPGHPMGRLRAQRPGPLAAGEADDQRLPARTVAGGGSVRQHARRSVLREVRCGDEPTRVD